MNENLNKIVLTKILSIIPENIKPVNFFMDVLDLGKESAYRRLRGEKALSFEEIYKLSLELDFSLDEIIENNQTNTFVFNHIGTYGLNPEKNLLEFLYYYESYLTRMVKAEVSETICTMNHLLNILLVGFPNLFKFTYYRWTHQMKEVPLNYLYADLVIPNEIKELCNRLTVLHQKVKKITFIIDNNLYLNMVKEMQYFFIRNLITESELAVLKEELLQYTDFTETIVKKGSSIEGTTYEIYLSMFHVGSTTAYSSWDDNEESAFWHYQGYPIFTRNKKITKRHKFWIDSLKKYSTIISHSNELLQADYFNKQRGYINNIAENILL